MLAGRPDCQLGILNHRARHHPRMENDFLDVIGRIGNDRCAPHFGAGARGGRDGQHRRHSRDIDAHEPVFAILEIKQRPRLANHQSNGLAHIQRAAATEGDDAVVTSGLVGRDAKHDVVADRVRLNARIGHAGHTGIGAQLDDVSDHRQLRQARVSDQQGTRHAE